VKSENTVFVISRIKTSHGAQARLLKRLYADMRLTIPRNPRWGGKPVSGRNAKSSMPVTAKKAMDASRMRLSFLNLAAKDTYVTPLSLCSRCLINKFYSYRTAHKTMI